MFYLIYLKVNYQTKERSRTRFPLDTTVFENIVSSKFNVVLMTYVKSATPKIYFTKIRTKYDSDNTALGTHTILFCFNVYTTSIKRCRVDVEMTLSAYWVGSCPTLQSKCLFVIDQDNFVSLKIIFNE